MRFNLRFQVASSPYFFISVEILTFLDWGLTYIASPGGALGFHTIYVLPQYSLCKPAEYSPHKMTSQLSIHSSSVSSEWSVS